MKKNEVKIGGVYTAKVSDRLVSVRIDAVKGTGWSATNLATGKTIYINSAQRLRGPAKDPTEPAAQKTTTSPTAARGGKKTVKATTKAKPKKAATRAKQGQRKAKKPSGLDAAARVLAADVATLLKWLREDVLSPTGPDHATRSELFDFLVAELRSRQPLCPHRIGPVVRALANQRDDLLAFAAQLDQDLAVLAAEFQVAVETARAVLNVELLGPNDPPRWPREAALRSQLGSRYFSLSVAMVELARQTVRASSLVENLNSRLRNYFFLRRHLGPDYLALLQFFLNHRRFLRNERPERVGKSPAELLNGSPHPHWLEMLGYARFSRN